MLLRSANQVVSRFPARPARLPQPACTPVAAPSLRQHQSGSCSRVVLARAAEGMPEAMTEAKALEVLGLTGNPSFEDVVKAKNSILSKVDTSAEQERVMEVEAAYDVLFMKSMKKRLSGELEVSTSVRYADVPPAPPKRGKGSTSPSPISVKAPSLPKLSSSSSGNGLGISVQMPRDTNLAATQAAVFAGLATWAIVQAVLESPDAQLSETAGLQMALSLAYGIYSLKENKGMQIGKAVGVCMVCLMGGALFGNLVENWLRVDIVPIGGFSSPGVLVTEFIIAGLAAGAILLV